MGAGGDGSAIGRVDPEAVESSAFVFDTGDASGPRTAGGAAGGVPKSTYSRAPVCLSWCVASPRTVMRTRAYVAPSGRAKGAIDTRSTAAVDTAGVRFCAAMAAVKGPASTTTVAVSAFTSSTIAGVASNSTTTVVRSTSGISATRATGPAPASAVVDHI